MKNIFFVSLIFFILASCGKNKEVKIIAKNAATGASYAGLEYKVISSRTAANGEKYKTEASGTLNSNGEAMVSIKKKSGRSYSIQVKAPENSCYTNQSPQFFESPFDVNGTFTFEFAECAAFKFRYHNIACFNANDQIIVNRFSEINDYTGFIIPAEYNGCEDYTTSDFISVPMGKWYFSWSVTKNGITNNYNDTLFLNAGENKYYEFNY